MTAKQGTLHQQPSGRWAIMPPGHDPVEITSGEIFRVEVDGELRFTRMEHLSGEGYYSIDRNPCATGCARRSAAGSDRRRSWRPSQSRHRQIIEVRHEHASTTTLRGVGHSGARARACPDRGRRVFSLEVRRAMRRTRMEQCDGQWLAVLSGVRGAGRRVELRDGLRAGFFDQRERYAKALGRD
jgi:hypothetical protein